MHKLHFVVYMPLQHCNRVKGMSKCDVCAAAAVTAGSSRQVVRVMQVAPEAHA
jgi:hypothetical protein